MTDRRKRWPNVGRIPPGSRYDTPRPEVAAMEEALHPSDGSEPEGIPMTGVDGVAGPGKTPPRAEGADGKPAEAEDEGNLSATSSTSPHSGGPEPDAKPAGRKGADKANENS